MSGSTKAADSSIEWTHDGFVVNGSRILWTRHRGWAVVGAAVWLLTVIGVGALLSLGPVAIGFAAGLTGIAAPLLMPVPTRCIATPAGVRFAWGRRVEQESVTHDVFWPQTVTRNGRVLVVDHHQIRLPTEVAAEEAVRLMNAFLATRSTDEPDAQTDRMRRLRSHPPLRHG